jgi:nucleotide-binding universal stress UspA family protein
MHVDGVARRLRDLGLHCEARLATGQVANEIVRCADEIDADVIVMSTHSAPWPARAYVGSIAQEVLRSGSRPVLLVRREALPGEPPEEDLSNLGLSR